MTKFAVYQPNLTDIQIAELNGPNGGWNAKPEFRAYADVTSGTFRDDEPKKADLLVRVAVHLGMFVHVSNITADTMPEVYRVGNIGPEAQIERTNLFPMKSVSVGDVIVEQGAQTAWFCDRRGWTQLDAETYQFMMANIFHRTQSVAA